MAAGSSADSLSPRLLPFLLAAAQPCFLLENIWAVGSELRPAGGFPHAPYTPWVGLGGTRCWWLDPLWGRSCAPLPAPGSEHPPPQSGSSSCPSGKKFLLEITNTEENYTLKQEIKKNKRDTGKEEKTPQPQCPAPGIKAPRRLEALRQEHARLYLPKRRH